MSNNGWIAALLAAAVFVPLAGCGSATAPQFDIAAIGFETTTVPPGDAGRLYNVVIAFTLSGGAAPPDRFDLTSGVLPLGVELIRDREDGDLDGLPDEDGAYTGSARLIGTPRGQGSFAFTIKAISTGALSDLAQAQGQPALAAEQDYVVNVGEGSIAILNPTAAEGTKDPQVPAFPDVIAFVNPANPKAFYSFSFLVAGGSGNNLMSIFAPRELELSVFDAAVQNAADPVAELRQDTDESVTGGAPGPFENDFSDGGWFVLQAGVKKVQVGGFQSPRGAVRVDPDGDGVFEDYMLTLLDMWFQDASCPKNGRRDFGDTLNLAGGDPTLGTPLPIEFCDYFDPAYKDTDGTVDDANRAKYPFTKDQYINAFYSEKNPGDLTPLKYNIIVQAIDTRGTSDKTDDIIARKSYLVQVQIPDIVIDTVFLRGGQAGVPYNEFVNASGGVPPLAFDLEGVDNTNDLELTPGDPLTKDLFGVELAPTTGQFIGLPRAAAPDADPSTSLPDTVSGPAGEPPATGDPIVELTVRVYADVMNPIQNGDGFVPAGGGAYDGTHPITGKKGRHKTFPVNFELPIAPIVANNALVPGIDGVAYPGATITGAGGVARLAPYPVGFFDNSPGADYPSATAQQAYEWSSTYVTDVSPETPPAGTVQPGMPNSLSLVGDAGLATNGQISGTPFDRGFLAITFDGKDFYVGDVNTGIDPTTYQTAFSKTLTLSVSPDKALYLRGTGSASDTVDKRTGLLDAAAQMGEPRMVPMFLSASLYTVETGGQPQRFDSATPGAMPGEFDLLPLQIPNGGNDNGITKSEPTLAGYFPDEQGKEGIWNYRSTEAWKHVQEETVWIQSPAANHARVFVWAETKIASYTNGTWTQKYQVLNTSPGALRGVLVVEPLTGKFYVPAVLDNTNPDFGLVFGAESVVSGLSTGSTSNPTNRDRMYNKYYYYTIRDSQQDRGMQLHGTGSYIDDYGNARNTSNGWYKNSMGRSGVSVAMSADGTWCATTLYGGSNTQKILVWRTDGQPVSDAFGASPPSHMSYVDGLNADGSIFPASAAIIRPAAGGVTINTGQDYIFPDSLMFVENGLLFLNRNNLDRIYGISLADGHVSTININTARTQVNGAGLGPSVTNTRGQYPPDNDWLRGNGANPGYQVQFSFTGDKPAAGEEGPGRIAFVAGDNRFLSTTLYGLSGTDYPRGSPVSRGNRAKAVFYLDLDTNAGGTGLDLSTGANALRDLTGSDSDIYGDLLTPGRIGEEQNQLAMSDNGKYVAVVRDYNLSTGTFDQGGFHTSASSLSFTVPSHDILVMSTDGSDMDSGTGGTQHVLFTGTKSMGSGNPTGMPTYATGKAHINARVRQIYGLDFAADNRTLLYVYKGNNSYPPLYTGGTSNWYMSPTTTGTFTVTQNLLVQFQFRTSSDGPINFGSVGTNLSNAMQGLTGIGGIGPTSHPFGQVGGNQFFWATFKSPDGRFMYYISDQVTGSATPSSSNRNYMVGFNVTSAAINGHDPFAPFSTHSSSVGFEQFDANAWQYDNRVASSPAGQMFNGRDADGILCIIASDASAGVGSSTDLEVYVMDMNVGGSMIALTSDITTGGANAINDLYLSANGNVLAGIRAATSTSSRNSRAALNGTSDLFVVNNIHAVLGGAAPNVFIASANQSHGSAIGFVGEGAEGGPQAIIFSSSAASSSNSSWSTRTLKVAAFGASPTVIDSTQSHYVVLGGSRKEDDNATTAD